MRYSAFIAFFTVTALAPLKYTVRSMTESSVRQTEERHVPADDEYAAVELAREETAQRRLADDGFVFDAGRGTTTGKEEQRKGTR